MPRGKKVLTPEETIAKLNAQIKEHEDAITVLKEQLVKIEAEEKAKKLEALDALIAKSGKSIDEIIELLNK